MILWFRKMFLTGIHLRMARAGLNWKQKEVIARAKIAAGTLKRMEALDGRVAAHTDTMFRIEAVYRKAGIEFLNDGPPGVRVHPIRNRK